MNVKVIKHLSNYTLLLLLITALFTMQWSTTHVHLVEQHNHGGIHHQHQAELHAHNLATSTVDVDYPHQTSHANILELDYECNFSKNEKTHHLSAVLVSKAFSLLQPLLLVSITIPVFTSTKLNYFDRSTVNLRAPPQTS